VSDGFVTFLYKEVWLCSEHISQKRGNAQKSTVFVKECQQETGARFLPAAGQKAERSFQHSCAWTRLSALKAIRSAELLTMDARTESAVEIHDVA